MNLLDHTIEAIMLKPIYAPLFSEGDLKYAHRKLKDLGHCAPWDTRKDSPNAPHNAPGLLQGRFQDT